MTDVIDIKSPPKKSKKTMVDEDALGRDVELLDMTNAQIGEKHGISESTVRYYIKKNGWVKKRLVSRVRTRIQRRLIQGDGAVSNEEVTDAMIEDAAEIGARVVTKHREHLQRLRTIAFDLTERIELVLAGEYDKTRQRETKRGTKFENWDFLSTHESISDALLKVTRVTKEYITLERQAYNIDEDTAPDEATYEQRLRKIAEKRKEDDPQQGAA